MAYPFDDNIRNYLRMNSMFGGDMSQNDMLPDNGVDFNFINTEGEDDQRDIDYFQSRMKQLYQPDTAMTDKFHTMINKMPERENPPLWRKLAAIGASFGAPENVERTLYSPYHRQMEDWMTHAKPVEDAAKLEMSNNVNLRSVANQILSQEAGQRRLERQINRDRVLTRQGDARIAGTESNRNRVGNQRDRALDQADRRITQNDVLKFEVDDQGKDVIITKDGKTIPVEGLDYVSAEEKARWKKLYSAANTRPRFRTEVIDDPDNPGKRILVQINQETNEWEPVKSKAKDAAGKPVVDTVVPAVRESSATEATGRAKDVTNKAIEFRDSHVLGKYVTIDKQGKPKIQKPGWGGYTGPSQKDYEKIYKAIYGTNGPGAEGTVLTNKPAAKNAVPANTPPAGFVRVIGPPDPKTGKRPTGRMSLQEWKSKDWTKEGWGMQ